MIDGPADLSYLNILAAACLILANGLISLALQLKLERRLAIASLRTIMQLLAIGYVLAWFFRPQTPWFAVALLMLLMSLIAGVAAVRRVEWRYVGIWLNSIVAVLASSWLVTTVALTVVIPPAVWTNNIAQYAVPLMGMILGNTLTGISLGIDRLGEELAGKRDRVEMLLTLGATRWEAAREPVRQAVRTGMIPIINSMMVVGVVSLPGIMTGQLLSGADPLIAVKYQIVIMFLIAAGTALGTMTAVLLSYLRLFNRRHQFQHGKLSRR
jgi:putative ABC transport system permease protein